MTGFRDKLLTGSFIFTGEITPPKGTDTQQFLTDADIVRNHVDAINITDNPRAHMRMGSLGGCCLLLKENIEPIFQMTGRDRNRIALQSDLLSAWALGIRSVLVTTGDHVSAGDHKGAKPVFDLDSAQLLYAIEQLNGGRDISGNPLSGATDFLYGAALNPFLEPQELNLIRTQQKINQGVSFFQTQPIFDIAQFETFIQLYSKASLKTPVIAGILVLKSAQMARFVNTNIPGIHIGDSIIDGLENAADPVEYGMSVAIDIGTALAPWVRGLHIMAIGLENKVGEIIAQIKKEIPN